MLAVGSSGGGCDVGGGGGGGDEVGEYCCSDVLDRLELSAESSSLSALNEPLDLSDDGCRSSCICLSSSRLEFNEDEDDEDEDEDEDDDDEDDEEDGDDVADDGRRCCCSAAGATSCCRATVFIGFAHLVTVLMTGGGPFTYVLVGGHNMAAAALTSSSGRGFLLITSGKSDMATKWRSSAQPSTSTTFSGMTSPRSLDMLRWRCSIRAFNDERPISAYGVLKYLLYGCSTKLWDRR